MHLAEPKRQGISCLCTGHSHQLEARRRVCSSDARCLLSLPSSQGSKQLHQCDTGRWQPHLRALQTPALDILYETCCSLNRDTPPAHIQLLPAPYRGESKRNTTTCLECSSCVRRADGKKIGRSRGKDKGRGKVCTLVIVSAEVPQFKRALKRGETRGLIWAIE